jgi:hypothetical protein
MCTIEHAGGRMGGEQMVEIAEPGWQINGFPQFDSLRIKGKERGNEFNVTESQLGSSYFPIHRALCLAMMSKTDLQVRKLRLHG